MTKLQRAARARACGSRSTTSAPASPRSATCARFPIDSLKIAKPFLDNVPDGEQETALVRGIIELGHNLDLEIVGEGIERAEQWHALREMGCDLVQGYPAGPPAGPGADREDARGANAGLPG